jgi:aquaporin Z
MKLEFIEVVGEFLGTLIYTYSISTSQGDPHAVAGCFYIAMAFTAYVSTPQFNPAVTLSMALRRAFHQELTIKDSFQFIVNVLAQIVASVLAGLLGYATTGQTFYYYVQDGFNHLEGFSAEMVYTALICATCLTIRHVTESIIISGAAISVGYFTGSLSVVQISLACFNPAAALGLNFVSYARTGDGLGELWIYILAPFVGAIIGTALGLIFIDTQDPNEDYKRTKSLEGFINS